MVTLAGDGGQRHDPVSAIHTIEQDEWAHICHHTCIDEFIRIPFGLNIPAAVLDIIEKGCLALQWHVRVIGCPIKMDNRSKAGWARIIASVTPLGSGT